MLKWTILFFISLAEANEFRLGDTGPRFNLRIKKTELVYVGETVKKSLIVNDCNRDLIFALNGELLQLAPRDPSAKGPILQIDGKPFRLDPNGEALKKVLTMDARMSEFFLLESQRCK